MDSFFSDTGVDSLISAQRSCGLAPPYVLADAFEERGGCAVAAASVRRGKYVHSLALMFRSINYLPLYGIGSGNGHRSASGRGQGTGAEAKATAIKDIADHLGPAYGCGDGSGLLRLDAAGIYGTGRGFGGGHSPGAITVSPDYA